MIRSMPLSDAERKISQELGQVLVDHIGEVISKQDATLNVVLVMLCSVVAHYIAGIPDLAMRQSVYNEFGAMLAEHLGRYVDNDDAPRAIVGIENAGKPN